MLTGTVEFELFFGLWLLANPWPRVGWVAALACFCIFGCVSLCKALSGYNTCGCFGRIVVNPFITATLDWVVVAPSCAWRSVGQGSPFTALSKKLISRLTLVLASWICFGVPMAVAAVGYGPARLGNDGLIVDDGSNLVVIDPIAWPGFPFRSCRTLTTPPTSRSSQRAHCGLGLPRETGLWCCIATIVDIALKKFQNTKR